jgi:type I restriction enzyme R subunit
MCVPTSSGAFRLRTRRCSPARRRMLFEMATGTGKTLTIAMLFKRWFQAAVCSRVLFLADRIELAKQAKETFDEYLKDYPSTLLNKAIRELDYRPASLETMFRDCIDWMVAEDLLRRPAARR